MNTEYKLTKKEKDALLQSNPIRGLAVTGVDTPKKYEITLRILDGSEFVNDKYLKIELDEQFEFYNGEYPYGMVFDDGADSVFYFYWSNKSANPENCKQLTFDELFEQYVVSELR